MINGECVDQKGTNVERLSLRDLRMDIGGGRGTDVRWLQGGQEVVGICVSVRDEQGSRSRSFCHAEDLVSNSGGRGERVCWLFSEGALGLDVVDHACFLLSYIENTRLTF